MSRVVRFRPLLLLGLIWLGFLSTGCGLVRQNYLLQSKEHRKFYRAMHRQGLPVVRLKPDTITPPYTYRLQSDDVVAISFVNFPDEYLRLLSPAAQGAGAGSQGSGTNPGGGSAVGSNPGTGMGSGAAATISVQVDPQGKITLPQIGRVVVSGMTTMQLRDTLESRFAQYVNQGYLVVRPTSLRVFLLGEASSTFVLPDEKTHLMELLTTAGNLSRVRVREVLIVRGNLQDPQLIWVDLHDINALRYPDLYLQPNDVVYMPPRYSNVVTQEVAQYLGLVNSIFFLMSTILFITR